MRNFPIFVRFSAVVISASYSLLLGCVNGEYHQPLGRTVQFPAVQAPVFQEPLQRMSSTSQVQPDNSGGYTVWNGDGSTSRMVPDGHGGWTIWH